MLIMIAHLEIQFNKSTGKNGAFMLNRERLLGQGGDTGVGETLPGFSPFRAAAAAFPPPRAGLFSRTVWSLQCF